MPPAHERDDDGNPTTTCPLPRRPVLPSLRPGLRGLPMSRRTGMNRQETEAERRVSRSYKEGFGGDPLKRQWGPSDPKAPPHRPKADTADIVTGFAHQLRCEANGGLSPGPAEPLSKREQHEAVRLASAGSSPRVLLAAAWLAAGEVDRRLIGAVWREMPDSMVSHDGSQETPF